MSNLLIDLDFLKNFYKLKHLLSSAYIRSLYYTSCIGLVFFFVAIRLEQERIMRFIYLIRFSYLVISWVSLIVPCNE